LKFFYIELEIGWNLIENDSWPNINVEMWFIIKDYKNLVGKF
jgi:hypothetical protein